MNKPRSIEQAKEVIPAYLAVPISKFLGIKFESFSLEEAEISLITTSQLLTPHDTLHAGIIYAALELANVFALLPHLSLEESAISIQHSVSLISTVTGTGKQVLIRARLLKRGSSIAFFESEAYDASNMKILAKGKTTKAIRRAKQQSKLVSFRSSSARRVR
jgi:uncharacterized protein (TIGR00369 family)